MEKSDGKVKGGSKSDKAIASELQTDMEAALDLLNFPTQLIPIIEAEKKMGKAGLQLRDDDYQELIDSTRAAAGAGPRSSEGGQGNRKSNPTTVSELGKGVSTIGSSTVPKTVSSAAGAGLQSSEGGYDSDNTVIMQCGNCSDEPAEDDSDDDDDEERARRKKQFRILMPLRRQEAAIGGVEIFDEKDDAASALAHDGKKIDKDEPIKTVPSIGQPPIVAAPAIGQMPNDYCEITCQQCIGQADNGCEFCCQVSYLNGFSDDVCYGKSAEFKNFVANVPMGSDNKSKRRFMYKKIFPILSNYKGYMHEHAGKIKLGLWPMPHCVGREIRLEFPSEDGTYTGFGNIGASSVTTSSRLNRGALRPRRPIGRGINYNYEDSAPKAITEEKEKGSVGNRVDSDEEEDKKKPVAKKNRLRL